MHCTVCILLVVFHFVVAYVGRTINGLFSILLTYDVRMENVLDVGVAIFSPPMLTTSTTVVTTTTTAFSLDTYTHIPVISFYRELLLPFVVVTIKYYYEILFSDCVDLFRRCCRDRLPGHNQYCE